MEISTEELAKRIAVSADDKKAEDIIVLDMREITTLADYFVICNGTSNTQVQAIVRSIEDQLAEEEIEPIRKEGLESYQWVVLDYADVMVHVFDQEQREYYELEKLWGDAERIDWKE